MKNKVSYFMMAPAKRSDEIFGGFVYRKYKLSNDKIRFELKLLKQCESLSEYVRISRVGASWAMNRSMRHSIWSLYENAIRHAEIESEMREAGAL